MKIMLLGESYTTGYGIQEEETFCNILNNDSTFPFTLYNFAEPGGSLDRCYRVGVENYDALSPDYTICVFPTGSYFRREVYIDNKFEKVNAWENTDLSYLLSGQEIEINVKKNIDAMSYRFKNFIFVDTKQDGFTYDFCSIPNDFHPGPKWNICMANYIREMLK